MTEEVWKDVPSKPGIKASSWGRIKLPELTRTMPNGGKRVYKTNPRYGTICKPRKDAEYRFRSIQSSVFGNLKVHRLVCEAFHGEPDSDKCIVIHLDEDGLNNSPENLKWGTQKENLNMPKFIDYCKSRTGSDSPVVKGRLANEKRTEIKV